MKNTTLVLVLLLYGRFGPLKEVWNVGNPSPSSFSLYMIGPWAYKPLKQTGPLILKQTQQAHQTLSPTNTQPTPLII